MRTTLTIPALLTLLAPLSSALRFSDLNPAVGSTYSVDCSEVLTTPLTYCKDSKLISILCSDRKCVRELSWMSRKAQKACENDNDEEDDTFLAMVKAGNVTDLVCPDADSSGFSALFKKLGDLRRRDKKDDDLVDDVETPQVKPTTTTTATSGPILFPTFISIAPTPGPPPPPPPERNQKFVFSGFMTFTTPSESANQELVTDSFKTSSTASSSTPSSSSSSKIDLVLDDIEPPTAIRNGDSGSRALDLQSKYVIEGASTASSVPLPTGKTSTSPSSLTSSGSKNGASKIKDGEDGGDEREDGEDEKEDVEAYSMDSGSAQVAVGGVWGVMALSGVVAVVVGLGN
ncbi:hypothetical protein EX30DRAFT_370673 [Ascodesmis nigricans]|uniref:Extracellular membrane protein CFEM domain-containing protein n=1 Tax=Ascodesmis nigricans TaxID=341454 RepID=A0A4S2N129_9PEZI|nr:hypothetical protein EX30DRAFT_370673 [Ascodesmis nigricans]